MKFPIPLEVLNQHIAVLAKTRSGKSSMMRLLVERMLDDARPVCVIDPKGDWWGLKSSADGKSAGYPVVIFGGPHADVPINEHSGAAVAELFATGNRPCIIDLKGWMPGERTRFFVAFASTLFKLNEGLRWVVVDEIHNFAPKGQIADPETAKALHWSNRLASEGLGLGIHLIFASQRPQKVHNDTLTSAETLVAMRVLHPSDRKAVSDWIEGCGDPALGKEVLNSMANLKRGEGWVWSPEIGFGPKQVQFPLFKTFDSFKPNEGKPIGKLKGWAEIDLAEVSAKLSKAVEEAKANDPKALKAEIAKLKAEIAKASTSAPADPDAIQRARDAGFDHGFRDGKLFGTNYGIAKGRAEMAEQVRRSIGNILGATNGLDGLCTDAEERWKTASETPIPDTAKHQRGDLDRAVKATRPASPSLGHFSNGAGVALPKAERLILTALAQYPTGRTKTQVAILTGYSQNGGGFNNALGSLRSKGYVEGRGEALSATQAGVDALGHYDPLPTGSALLNHWSGQLPKAERAILLKLAEHYPGTLTKEDLAAEVGYEAKGGGFNNALGKLRTLELINRGVDIQASPDLFG